MSSQSLQSLNIPLDPALHLWVLLPITIATLLMGLFRRNISRLTLRPPPTTLTKLRDANILQRAKSFRNNSSVISVSQFEARREYFQKALVKPPNDSPMTALMNPESMANQVVSILMTLVPHMLIGTWARYSFAGLAVCRLPFTLTPRFRGMLQTGIEVAGLNLDVSYVSSLSWYILNLFGNAGLLNILEGGKDDNLFVPDVTSQISMNIAPDRIFRQQRDSIRKMSYVDRTTNVEDALLEIDPQKFASF